MLVVVDGVTRKETVDEFRARMESRMAEARRRRELDEAAARSQQAAAMRRTTTARKAADHAAQVPVAPQKTPAPPVAASVPALVVQDPVPVVPVASPAPPAPRAHPTAPAPAATVVPRPVPRPAPPAARPQSVSARDRARLAAITAVVQGDPVAEVAARQHVAISTIYKWLHEAQIALPSAREPVDRQAVVDAYTAGATVQALADQQQTSVRHVRRLLAEAGVVLRVEPRATRPGVLEQQRDVVLAAAAAGAGVEALAARFGVHRTTVSAFLRAAGVEVVDLRSAAPHPSKLDPHREAVIAAYESGESAPQLGARFGVTAKTARDALARWGVQVRDDRPGRSGGRPKDLGEYPAELVAAVVDAYTSGLSKEAVAVAVPGVTSVKVVGSILAKSGTPVRPSAATRQRSDAEHAALLAQIDALLAQGMSHAQVGARLGFGQPTISRWLRQRAAAAPPPPPGLPAAAPSAPAPLSTPPDVAPDPLAEPLEPAARAPDPPTHADVRAHATAIVSGLLDAAAALAEVAAHVHPLVDAATAALVHLSPEEP